MIKQVALLTEMMKGIQDDRARSEVNEKKGEEEGVREAEEREPSDAEEKSEPSLEMQKEMETVEVESVEKEINTPHDNEALQEILEEAKEEPHEEGDEVIKRDVELGNTLLYLQLGKIHVLGEKVESSTIGVDGENAPAERPPPVIDKSDGCCYDEESESELKEERLKRGAVRFIYWVQLQPWPEPLRMGEPPDPGLRTKGNKKVQGTYKNHKKKWACTLVNYPQKNRWIERRRVNSGPPNYDCSHNGSPISELIKLDKKSNSLDPINCKGSNGNHRMEDSEKGRKLPTNETRHTASTTQDAGSRRSVAREESDPRSADSRRDQPRK